jgi:putative transposase
VLPRVAQRRVCQVLAVARRAVRRPVRVDRRRAGSVNEPLVTRLTALIERHPTFGYRRLWAILRFRDGQRITPKTVYRICALKRWFVHQRPVAPRPRVQGRISHAGRSNERWATDLTHVYCGRDGWAHLVAVIDCHDRELIGHEFALRGRAKEAERALEEACLERFGTLRPAGATPVVRSDNA